MGRTSIRGHDRYDSFGISRHPWDRIPGTCAGNFIQVVRGAEEESVGVPGMLVDYVHRPNSRDRRSNGKRELDRNGSAHYPQPFEEFETSPNKRPRGGSCNGFGDNINATRDTNPKVRHIVGTLSRQPGVWESGASLDDPSPVEGDPDTGDLGFAGISANGSGVLVPPAAVGGLRGGHGGLCDGTDELPPQVAIVPASRSPSPPSIGSEVLAAVGQELLSIADAATAGNGKGRALRESTATFQQVDSISIHEVPSNIRVYFSNIPSSWHGSSRSG